MELVWRQRKNKPLRLVVLLDASGSMSMYSAVFLRFMHGILDTFREAEAFVFHTRLIHISPALRERDATRAVERMSILAQGVGGGTRIGESLGTFNRWHAKRAIHARTCVMIVSDGYDTGPAEQLGREMAALRRRCRRIAWLNPMIGWARLCAGGGRHEGGAAPCRSVRSGAQSRKSAGARTLSGKDMRS